MIRSGNLIPQLARFVLQIGDFLLESRVDAFDTTDQEQTGVDRVRIPSAVIAPRLSRSSPETHLLPSQTMPVRLRTRPSRPLPSGSTVEDLQPALLARGVIGRFALGKTAILRPNVTLVEGYVIFCR